MGVHGAKRKLIRIVGGCCRSETFLNNVIERKVGFVVLFDTIGIHGAVTVAPGERWIARFHLVDRKCRFWNHPEQEGFPMGLFSRFCRKVKRIVG